MEGSLTLEEEDKIDALTSIIVKTHNR